MKLKAGDKVKLKDCIATNGCLGGFKIFDKMAECAGEVAEIECVDEGRGDNGAVYLQPIEETSDEVDIEWWFPVDGVEYYHNIEKGDTVRIREDLEIGEMYGNITLLNSPMADNRGELFTVQYVGENGSVELENSGFFWHTKMLEKIYKGENKMGFDKGDKVLVKENVRGDWRTIEDMYQFIGEVVTIERCEGQKSYNLEEDPENWSFFEDNLELVEDKKYPELYFRDKAEEEGQLIVCDYDGIVDWIEGGKGFVVTDCFGSVEKILKKDAELVTKSQAKELAKEYHQEKIEELS